jgi:hypothetical protein
VPFCQCINENRQEAIAPTVLLRPLVLLREREVPRHADHAARVQGLEQRRTGERTQPENEAEQQLVTIAEQLGESRPPWEEEG